MRIVKNYIYILHIETPIKVFNLKKLKLEHYTQVRGYFGGSLTISIKHGLIAYACEQVHLYDIRTKTEKCSKFIGHPVSSLAFAGCYVLCGTELGKVFYLNSWDLDIRKLWKKDIQENLVSVSEIKDHII